MIEFESFLEATNFDLEKSKQMFMKYYYGKTYSKQMNVKVTNTSELICTKMFSPKHHNKTYNRVTHFLPQKLNFSKDIQPSKHNNKIK